MPRAVKHLVWIGDNAWVDPMEVIAVDGSIEPDDPHGAHVRIILSTDRVIFGTLEPAQAVAALRNPDSVQPSEEVAEAMETDDEVRRRRRIRRVPATPEPLQRPSAPRQESDGPTP